MVEGVEPPLGNPTVRVLQQVPLAQAASLAELHETTPVEVF